MADIDDVLERLVTDPVFRARLAADPAAALAGYELSPAEREMLATPPDDGRADLSHGVEQRTSKSALVGLLAAVAPGPDTSPIPEPAARPELEELSFTFHKIDMDAADSGDLLAPGDGDDAALLVPAVQKVREAATGVASPDGALTDTPPVSHSEALQVDGFTIERTAARDAGGAAPPEPDAPPLQPPREPSGDGRDIPVLKITDHDVYAPPSPPDEDFLTVDDT